MGTMTRGDFKTELGFLLRNRTDSDATNETRIEQWINQAYHYMCHPSVHDFYQMNSFDTSTTLVTGDNTYSVETLNSRTMIAINSISHIKATTFTNTTNRTALKPRSIHWFERRTLQSGPPLFFARSGGQIFISGVPRSQESGQLLRIHYTHSPDNLNPDTAQTVLPRYYDRVLLKFAQSFAEGDLGDRARALLTLKEASGLLNNTPNDPELDAEQVGSRVDLVLENPMGP